MTLWKNFFAFSTKSPAAFAMPKAMAIMFMDLLLLAERASGAWA
jgi:hypothetical protein